MKAGAVGRVRGVGTAGCIDTVSGVECGGWVCAVCRVHVMAVSFDISPRAVGRFEWQMAISLGGPFFPMLRFYFYFSAIKFDI